MEKIVDFYEIYEELYPPFWQTTWFKVVVVLAILAILAVVVFFVRRKKKQHITPDQWALHELEKINLASCTNKEDFKKLYFELSSIVKTYLKKRYGWAIDDKTDDELISFLNKKKFNQEIVTMLEQIAQGSVWIKFANQMALKSQAENDVKIVRVMIEKTKEQSRQ